jgi:hypothetical protein
MLTPGEGDGNCVLRLALTDLPRYEPPLTPLYEALAAERPLTLRALRQHSDLLAACVDEARDQAASVKRVIQACQKIPPIPLPSLPLGF